MSKTFGEALDVYLVDVKERCATSSYNNYRKRMTPFRAALGSRLLSDITATDIVALLESVNHWPDGTKKAPDTIRGNVMGWENFQTWMLENEWIDQPITPKKLKKPGGRKRELLPTADETKSILAAGSDDFRMIYRALRLTGARPGELCKALITDIDAVTGEIVLYEHKTAKKTGKPRRIAVGHPALIEIIKASSGTRTTGHIFLRANGRPWRTELVSAAFRTARNAAGARKGLVLYLARHEHATTLYKIKGDLKTVADALGHASLNTTMRYTRVDSDTLKKAQCLFNEGLS